MNAIDLKRAEFRHYLENSGVMDALSYALIKLYDEIDKPADPVAFVRKHFKRPDDDIIDNSKKIEDLSADELIKKQQRELELAREEIAKLRSTLNEMAKNCENGIDVTELKPQVVLEDLLSDSKYEGTAVKKVLTADLFDRLIKIDENSSFLDCIKNFGGVYNNVAGIVAVNADCYTVFEDFFEPMINELNGMDILSKHPDSNWGDTNVFENLNCSAIVSTEINCRRSLVNVPFITGMDEQDFENVLSNVQNAIQLSHTDDKEIDEEFFKITDINANETIFDELKTTELGFRTMNPCDHRLWPTGRGVYVNSARTQSILINEEDHVSAISKEMNSDFGSVYRNLVTLIKRISERLEFARNDKFGWLTTNPANVGSSVSCQINMKLTKPTEYLKEACDKHDIEFNVVDSSGESENECIVQLRNRRKFARTEFEGVNAFYESIKEIIQVINDNGENNENSNEKNANIADEVIEENKIEAEEAQAIKQIDNAEVPNDETAKAEETTENEKTEIDEKLQANDVATIDELANEGNKQEESSPKEEISGEAVEEESETKALPEEEKTDEIVVDQPAGEKENENGNEEPAPTVEG